MNEAGVTTLGEVKSAARVLQEDVMCQSFIQSSSTLAYACILMRHQQYDLAGHVLKALVDKKSGKYRDIVFYLQIQIDIELGLYAPVKHRLVGRLRQQPADAVALSLLQACLQEELRALPADALEEIIKSDSGQIEAIKSPSLASQSVGMNAEARASSVAAASSILPAPSGSQGGQTLRPPAEEHRSGSDSVAGLEVELVPFQPIMADAGTKAFALWSGKTSAVRRELKDPTLAEVIESIPNDLPNALTEAVQRLEGGAIQKICFAYQNLTVTSLHHRDLNLGLVTGPLNQSLITVVRAETLFSRRAAQVSGKSGEREGAN